MQVRFDASVFRPARPAGPLDHPGEIVGVALAGLVAQHLRAWIACGRSRATLPSWRPKARNEVDFGVSGRR